MKQESRFGFVRNLTDIFNAVAELEAENSYNYPYTDSVI